MNTATAFTAEATAITSIGRTLTSDEQNDAVETIGRALTMLEFFQNAAGRESGLLVAATSAEAVDHSCDIIRRELNDLCRIVTGEN
jgi:hypothetical protein